MRWGIGLYLLGNAVGKAITINDSCYCRMITEFWGIEWNNIKLENM